MNGKNSRILVLGAGGLLGSELVPYLIKQGHTVLTHGRSAGEYRFNLESFEDTKLNIANIQPDLIINLAGLTNVDRCENEPHQAYLNNVKTVENITDCFNSIGHKFHLVHISTDQVYDGYGEQLEHEVKLRNYYAFSKYAGELAAASINATILRTNFFGRSKSKNRVSFSDWLHGALLHQEKINVFSDIQFNPLSMGTLSKMIETAALKKFNGVFNLGSHGGLSKADFAFAFAKEIYMSDKLMIRIDSSKTSNIKAYRPKNMIMNVNKFEDITGLQLPCLIDEIKIAAKDYI